MTRREIGRSGRVRLLPSGQRVTRFTDRRRCGVPIAGINRTACRELKVGHHLTTLEHVDYYARDLPTPRRPLLFAFPLHSRTQL